MNLNNEWEMFNIDNTLHQQQSLVRSTSGEKIISDNVKCSPLYISTKTKIAYFDINCVLNINEIFWKLPIIEYHNAKEGILKKQIKCITTSATEFNEIQKKLDSIKVKQSCVLSTTNNNKDLKYIQKISVGVSKKDILSSRMKQKGVFYNCFALVVRIYDADEKEFKEIHIKVFNTGKMEIPGIQNDKLLIYTIKYVFDIIKRISDVPIQYDPTIHTGNTITIDTVLINANFNCGYFIKRNEMYDLLRNNYNIISMYDPCSYPGIQSKFYYNKKKDIQNGKCDCETMCGKGKHNGSCNEVSFMIFRTGSGLIVGHCTEIVIHSIYTFLKDILNKHMNLLQDGIVTPVKKKLKNRQIKRVIVLSDR